MKTITKEPKLASDRMRTLIVILNWNNPNDTIKCLDSVMNLNTPSEDYSIALIDNFSDNSWNIFKSKVISLGYELKDMI